MYRDHPAGVDSGWNRFSTLADDARLPIFAYSIPIAAICSMTLPTGPAIALALGIYGVAGVTVLFYASRTRVLQRFGPANRVTWLRAGLTAVLAGALAATHTPELLNWWSISALAGIALALDGVDGWLARRHALSSPFGARFDMETDAALILVLSLLIGLSGKTGMWIVAAGAIRYGFVAAGWLWPALTHPLPPSTRRRAVCAIQVSALLACLLPVVTNGLATVIGGMALAMLCFSFGRDILWLMRRPPNQSDD